MPEFERDSYGCKKKSRYLLENHQIRMNYKKILRLEKKFGLKIHNRVRKHPKDYYVYKEECSKNLPENIKLHKDPNMENAVYTTDNIPPTCFVNIAHMDLDEDKITWEK